LSSLKRLARVISRMIHLSSFYAGVSVPRLISRIRNKMSRRAMMLTGNGFTAYMRKRRLATTMNNPRSGRRARDGTEETIHLLAGC